jgi:simple sugar transport system ATP-binding protein
VSGALDGGPAAELALVAIDKRFNAVPALDRAELTLRPGTVHALLGENGAGKSTLMRIAYGMLQPDGGALFVRGHPTRLRSPAGAIALGIGMVHQHFTHVAAMTVAENVALGGRGRFRRVRAEERVAQLGHETGLVLDPRARAGELPVSAQQRLEILKALARDARVLILDEPTAVLAPVEAQDLLTWLRTRADRGHAVVLITHKLREALAIADDVTVLRNGRTVLSSPAAAVTSDQLATAMLGETAGTEPPRSLPEPGAVAVRLTAVNVSDSRGLPRLVGATAEIRAGEIVGVAGVEHSGHHELLQVIAGRTRPDSGHLERAGAVAYVPEDRQREALVMSFTLVENVALKGAGARRGRARWSEWRDATDALVAEHDVRPRQSELTARALSGGNQQKLVMARELADHPSILVAENPTRGLDIKASSAVRIRLREAAAAGMAVVVHSSDLDEILSLATRMLVVHAGRLRSVPNNRDDVGRAMLGLS